MIPNPWDVGSARGLEAVGFQALATTSSGFAFTLGQLRDARRGRSHVSGLTQATDLPVSVDLENGYGATSERPARAIVRVAEEAGAVGGSIEDWDPSGHLYDKGHAAERIAAAAKAAHALPFPFMLTARAENHIRGHPDLDDTIARLQTYEASGPTSCMRPACGPGRSRLSGGLPAGERARAAGHVDDRDLRGGCPARERRRWSHLGRG
ncbi:MAG: isocitrate lyase/phosphoenolpyruvate mutase family protein, partial [Microvirga sp.]